MKPKHEIGPPTIYVNVMGSVMFVDLITEYTSLSNCVTYQVWSS